MINLTTKGRGIIEIDGVQFILKPGDIVFLHNSNHHILKKMPGEDWEFSFIHIFESSLISRMYQAFITKNNYISSNNDISFYLTFFNKIGNLLAQKQDKYELEISIQIYSLILNLISSVPQKENLKISSSISGI